MKKRWEYTKKYRQNNANVRMAKLLSERVRTAIKLNYKKTSVPKLIGCSIQEARRYLESKFLPSMTWENWGQKGWHIDHIKPCTSFDLTKEEEQKKCFHYTNMQPLWSWDNQSHNQHSDKEEKIKITNKPRNKIVELEINTKIRLPSFLADEIKERLKDKRVEKIKSRGV